MGLERLSLSTLRAFEATARMRTFSAAMEQWNADRPAGLIDRTQQAFRLGRTSPEPPLGHGQAGGLAGRGASHVGTLSESPMSCRLLPHPRSARRWSWRPR